MSNIVAEFTIEPFEPSDPGPHVVAAINAAQAGATSEVIVEVGPFGTAIAGPRDAVLPLVHQVCLAAFESGASRVSTQISTQSTD